ncbi:MAG: DNA-directed RNA polymerase subunit alpha [Planctomycetes bacterium]|nr:DNA-directed RNA polymerase subunit alpha [Planctomycetota bacterium]
MRIRWRNLELPNRVTVDEDTYCGDFGEFTIEPFERGYGHTIGNSLRRVLLSSLEGTAATALKIESVPHEFTAMPRVVEDVTDIVLNLKSLLVRLPTDEPIRLTLERRAAGEVLAGDLHGPAFAEVVNSELRICTLSEDIPPKEAPLKFWVEVRRGRGYVTAEENEPEDREPGVIYLDSIFSPVRRVSFRVENTRVGKLTNYDRLILSLWTDGTVAPELALVEGSKILRKHLNCLVQYPGPGTPVEGELSAVEEERPVRLDPELLRKLSMPIADLGLSVRASNCVESENIRTVGDLVARDESQLLAVRNFGKTSLKEILDKLEGLGLELGMDVSEYLARMEAPLL